MKEKSRKGQNVHGTFSRTPLSTALQAMFVAGALGGATGLANAAPEKPWAEGQILVKPKAGLSESEFDKILTGHNAQSKGAIGDLPVHIVSVPPQAEEAVARALSRNPSVEFAELDMAVEFSATTPNDARYSYQWHLPKIQAPVAWDFSKAENIVVAVLDTGVDGTHPDLSGKLLPGWNAVDGSNNTSDINGHGTAVTGAVGAATNNSTGVAAVAWGAMILPVRISNTSDGWAQISDIAAGLNWAANQGADVANISFAVSGSPTVTNAAQYMRSKGGLVVVAGGNDGVDPGIANNAYMISVSATDSSDAKASWSNYGAFIDVAAPGVSIPTTTRGGGYANGNGTSYASPITAGVVAEIMGANPALSADQVEQILKNSADKIAGDIHPYYGYGRVNVATAVNMAMNSMAVMVDSEAPKANIFSPGSGSTVSGLVLVEVNASDNVGVTEVSLYANGAFVGTDGTAPYQFSWDSKGVADGSLTLSAVAVDAAGNEGASAKIGVTVKNITVVDQIAPTVTISKPADGSKVSGVLAVGVAASDDVSVVKVQLYIDGRLVSSVNGGALSYSWNTKKAKAGAHTIEAVATDGSNKTAKKAVTVYK